MSGRALTWAQVRALGGLSRSLGTGRRTAKQLGVRSDVLWRLEQGGLVRRSVHDEWTITSAGQAAYESRNDAI